MTAEREKTLAGKNSKKADWRKEKRAANGNCTKEKMTAEKAKQLKDDSWRRKRELEEIGHLKEIQQRG
jgi:hypothetical protein